MSYLSRRVREDGQGRAHAEEWARYLTQDAIAKAFKRVDALNRTRTASSREPINFRGRAG